MESEPDTDEGGTDEVEGGRDEDDEEDGPEAGADESADDSSSPKRRDEIEEPDCATDGFHELNSAGFEDDEVTDDVGFD